MSETLMGRPAADRPEQGTPVTVPGRLAEPPLPVVEYPTVPDRRSFDQGRMHGRWGMYPLLTHGAYSRGFMVGWSETRIPMPRCRRCGYGHAVTAQCR